MDGSTLKNFAHKVQNGVAKHTPEILMGIGIAGMVTTTIISVKATPKALKLMDTKKEELGVDKLSAVDTVKTTWKCYVPAVVTGVASAACLIGSTSVSVRRTAALATAYNISQNAIKEYKDAVIETVGEKKAEVIKDKVAEKQIEKYATGNNVIVTGNGQLLCLDPLTGTEFTSSREAIEKAVNKINYLMTRVGRDYASLHDFYEELGIDTSLIKISDEIGWRADKGQLEVDFTYGGTKNGSPCLVINYEVEPRYGYDRY